MPKKTIYVREEDMPVFDEAMAKLGGEESMGSVIVDALRERLRNREKEEEEALRLALAAACVLPPILEECVEYRLRDLPKDAVVKAHLAAAAAYLADPDFFIERGYHELDDERWFEEAKEKAEEGKRQLRVALARAKAQMRGEGLALAEKERLLSDKEKRFLKFAEALLSELEPSRRVKGREQ